jgi:solute carrier family 25 aspartate/glutamate transporter 12/13
MEASIIFHFAGRGSREKRLALLDFAQLLDPQWRSPHEILEVNEARPKASLLQGVLKSAYGFVQGGTLSIVQHYRDATLMQV